MKIVVIGTGAMGSVYAGLLADAGNEVWAVDLWAAHLDAIRERGLRVEGASGDRVVQSLKLASSTADIGPADLVIIATKAAGVAGAAASLPPLLTQKTLVLTIQNGLGAGERIGRHMKTGNLLLGVAGGFGASIRGPGHVHHNGMELIRIGELKGGLTERVEEVAGVWRAAGFKVKAFADINQLVWEKFICNVAFSAPCTLFERTIGEILADEATSRISAGCAAEADAVARAKGIALSFDDPIAYVREFGGRMPHARPSMLLDHMAQRKSEIDAINGMVPVVGAEVGIETPYNEVVSAAVRAREDAF
jgi:2-dehydropantoate 2-reductase